VKEYNLVIHEEVNIDIDNAVEYKRENGTYEANIQKFKKEVKKTIRSLKTSPKAGSNLSNRVDIDTKKKYFLVDNYLLVFEIIGEKEVHVFGLYPTRSNWTKRDFGYD